MSPFPTRRWTLNCASRWACAQSGWREDRFALPRESPHPVPLPQGERGLCGTALRQTSTPESHLRSSAVEFLRLHPLQLVDEAADHAQPLRPERRIGGVEAEGGQQLLVALGAAGA